jgi:serine/threonine-protein kinase
MNEISSRQAEQLFLVALELKPDRRLAFLDEACAGDPEMRAEVEALLEAAARSEDYFEKLPERLGVAGMLSGAGDAGGDAAGLGGEPGAQFGQYRLTEPVGRGGMGAVWRAERSDGRYEGEVALKLLAHGTGTAAAERFAREARYLAKLTHPNIARLLDAGVGANGQPYLVLEFVDGVPIDRYCDEHALGIEERVRLFLAVLDAVAHAHAHLIVHRDVKPSNVQVTRDGTVKLLDFGVAKLLTDDIAAGLTRELGAALTPEYAAPEQLDGEPVTTATDVYSLGLLLWLLLTGSNPRETAQPKSLAELRALAHKEPTRLPDAVTSPPTSEHVAEIAQRRNASTSELVKTLRSDLDNIVRKALAVSPADRYETVADFAQDLRRWLAHEPVTAQAQTIGYRARKFVRRHRGGVLAASLTALALIAAAAITTWQGMEARRQRDLAVHNLQRLQATNEFLSLLLKEVGSGGEALTLVDLLDRGTAMLDRQFGADDAFIAETLYQISYFYATLGMTDRQLETLTKAEEIAREIDDRNLQGQVLCARSQAERSTDPEAAERHFREGRALLAEVSRPSIDARQACHRAEAQSREAAGDREGTIAALHAALAAVESSPMPSETARAVLLNDLAEQYYKADQANEALAMNAELIATLDRIGRGGTLDQVIYLLNRAAILTRMGEVFEAAATQEQALGRLEQLEAAGHILVGARGHFANTLVRLARYEEALELLVAGRAAAEASGNTRWVAQHDLMIGIALGRLGRTEESEQHLAAAESVYVQDPQTNARLFEELSLARARNRLHEGDVAGARAAAEAVLARAGYPQRKDAPGLASYLYSACEFALAAGDWARAEQYASDAYDVFLRIARDPSLSADIGQFLLLRGKARHAQGSVAAAATDLEQALVSLTNGFGEDHPDTREARELLASLR